MKRNLKKLTNHTGTKKSVSKEKAFNFKEVTHIIRLCHQLGVELSFGDLKVIPRLPAKESPVSQKAPPADTMPDEKILNIQKEEQEKSLTKDELELRQDQIDFLHITNPLEAERMISSGELVDDADDGDDGEPTE